MPTASCKQELRTKTATACGARKHAHAAWHRCGPGSAAGGAWSDVDLLCQGAPSDVHLSLSSIVLPMHHAAAAFKYGTFASMARISAMGQHRQAC